MKGKKAMKKIGIKETQNLLLKVMKEFDLFCRVNGLHYYMIGGTLLGAIRHKGFIPWDDDIDVGMMRNDYEKFISLSTKFPSNYIIENYRNSKKVDFVLTRIYIPNTYIDNPYIRRTKLNKCLYFDIFPLDYVPNDEKLQRKQERSLCFYKKLLSRLDLHTYSNNIIINLCKKVISLILQPFRTIIIRSMDKIMSQYNNSGSNFVCSMASQYSYTKQKMPIDIYGEPQIYQFQGNGFMGPKKADDYLKQLYGPDYMIVPPVEKRKRGFDVYWEK